MNSRVRIIEVLRTMPDEAFGYVVLALKNVVQTNEANHGFTHESTKAFVDLAKALNIYVGEGFIDMELIKQHNPMLFKDEPT